MNEQERIAKEALIQIIDYIGCDEQYKQHAALISIIERAMKQAR